jgi:DNA-binding MarR family transcriptional regulator
MPKVYLLNPVSQSIVTNSIVQLKWLQRNTDLNDVSYDIYFDTQDPPENKIATVIDENRYSVDGLIDLQTYYWTIVAHHGEYESSAISGVWTFKVEFSFQAPSVVLNYPNDKHSIITRNPTLTWYVNYHGNGKVLFDIYFGTSEIPELVISDHPKNSYTPDFELEEFQVYYWKVVPKADNKIGQGSDIWRFRPDLEFNPIDELKMTISSYDVILTVGEPKSIDIQIKNFAEFETSVSLKAILPSSISSNKLIMKYPRKIEIAPGNIYNLNLTLIAGSSLKQQEFELEFELISQVALELGLESEKSTMIYVKVLDSPRDGASDNNNAARDLVIYIMVILLIIIIIITSLRIEKDRIFRNVLRKVIHKTIEDNPGIHFRKLMRDLSLKPGTLSYHINILEKKGHIKSIQKGIYRCFYLTNIKSDFKIVLSALSQNVLHTINEHPGITLSELSSSVGKNKMLLNYHTHKLEDAGMIVKRKKGKIVSYTPTALAAIYLG